MGSEIKVEFRDYDVYKLAIIGSGKVGKTSICRQLTEGTFLSEYKPTVGADFFSMDFKNKNGKAVGLFYDFAGQERFQDVRKVLYPGTNAAAIVYDVSERQSFRDVAQWVRELKEHLNDIDIAIIGNKIDSKNRQVSKQDAEKISKKLGCKYVETSAKTGEGLGDFIKTMIGSASIYHETKLNAGK